MKEAPDVSVIISNYNSSDLINDAVESVIATAGSISFEIILVDDLSTDGGFARVDERYKKDPRCIFVQLDEHVGYSALNKARQHFRGRYYMTLDTDARLLPGALEALVAFMDATPHAGAATANLRNPDGSIQNYYRRLMTPTLGFYTSVFGRVIDKYFLGLTYYEAYHYSDFDPTRVCEIEQPPTACLMLRPEALDPHIMDPSFHLFIDVDLCRRIYDKGYNIYLVPEANVTHIKSVAISKRSRGTRERLYYRGLMAYFRKHYPMYAPFLTLLFMLDWASRELLESTVGRAPMR